MKGIYIIENTKTKFVYIGSSVDIELRIEEHFIELKKGKHGNWKLQKAFKLHSKYFTWKVLEEYKEEYVDRDRLYDREQYYLDTIEKQYNILRDARAHLIKNRKKRLAQNKKFIQRKFKF